MKKYVFLCAIAFCVMNVQVFAQKQTVLQKDYSVVKSSGIIPDDISSLFSLKFAKDLEVLKKSKISRKERLAKEEYLEQSHYYLNQMLTSGKIIYGSPFNAYLDKILDKLLVNEPELRSKIRIYIIKSPEVNAAATSTGIIFVNLGLLAQSGSESQLAYILAHEIIHYTKDHNITLYLEKDKLKRSKEGIRSSKSDNLLFKMHFRSREMESEADELGFKNYFSNSNYSIDQIFETFDVLQYSYLPFDEIPFNQMYLTDSVFMFPNDLFPKTINAIKARDDYDDSESTHPNLKKRREAMSRLTEKIDNKGRELNPQGKDQFLLLRDMARFECIRLNLINNDFAEAFYNTWVMEQDYPNNLFLEKAKIASLYGVCKYKRAGKTFDVIPSEKKTEGEMHKVVFLFSKLKGKELYAATIRNAWKAKTKYPQEKYFDNILNSLFPEFVKSYKTSPSDFSKTLQNLAINKASEDSAKVSHQSRKLNNIQKKKSSFIDTDYIQYMFADLMNNKDFIERFSSTCDSIGSEKEKQVKNNIKKKGEEDEDEETATWDNSNEEGDEDDAFDIREQRKIEKHNMLKGCRIGVGNVLVYNPFYKKFDFRYDPELQFLESEERQIEFIELYKDNAKRVGLQNKMILPSEFSGLDQDIYNDHVLLNEWTDEFFNWKIKGEPVMFTSNEISEITQKYNTKYLDLTGVISSRAKNYGAATNIVVGIFFPPYLPFAIYDVSRPSFYTVYYNMLIDLEMGKVIFVTTASLERSDKRMFLNSKIYDSLNQIKSK